MLSENTLVLNTFLAKVAVDLPALSVQENNYFYYSIPDDIKDSIKPGTVIRIPFGRQELNGYVIETINSKDIETNYFIKPIYDILYDKPVWDKNYLKLADWISSYYLTNIGTVLSLSVNQDILNSSTIEVELKNKNIATDALSTEEQFIIDKLLRTKKKGLSYRFLLQKSKFNKNKFYKLINQLKNKGLIISKVKYKKEEENKDTKKREKNSAQLLPITSYPPRHNLNNEQKKAFEIVLEAISKNKSETYLLHGITGSGKTEVYLHLIEETLKRDKTVIYLVPEIYLVPQVLSRLSSRFDKDEVIVWHSSLSKKDRIKNWERLQEGSGKKVKIVLGARSAILAPIKDLGLIVIDEAHDSSYKQSSPAPRYNTINVASKKSEIESCPVILGTATPNITDYHYCQRKNTILELSKRINDFKLPDVHIIDMRSDTYKSLLSNVLKTNINDALSRNEQIVLLLNRRGYASHLFCKSCGYIQYCKNCSVPMVYHKNSGLVICHHCGHTKGMNTQSILNCPECKSPHFKYSGLGTQQLEEEVKHLFKSAKILRVDGDELRKKDQAIHLWNEFSSHKADILIGTQLVAKGLDLPNVTVVGVIHADSMLNFPDYVSYERAFQLLTQVTGRAGRGEKPGKVFIQTYQPENQVFNFIKNHDYINFFKREIKQREEYSYPPYTLLSRIIFQSLDETECINYANETLKLLNGIATQSFLGPAPCFFTKLLEKYRYHILCKFPDLKTKDLVFSTLMKSLPRNAKVELIVDIDSVNFL